MIGGAIAEYLKADASIAAIVNDRVFLKVLPQKVPLPAISYFSISTVPISTHRGTTTLYKSLFQFDIWTEAFNGGYSSGRDLALKVESRLNEANETKVIDTESVSAVHILESGVDMYDPEVDENRVMLEARIWHTVIK